MKPIKMKRILLSFLFFLSGLSFAFAQLTLIVDNIPGNTPVDADIHAAGTFNGWDPGDTDFILQYNNDSTLQITIEPPVGQVKYKFTRGDWVSVEGNENGTFLPDRIFNYDGTPTTVEHDILSWEDLGAVDTGGETDAENVIIYDVDFFIPQLNRNRRIWIYLPPDYETSEKHYPVLYMHDGQNLFDVNTSFAGEWEIDESLNTLFANGDEGIIVVGIDNGGIHRSNEYIPWDTGQFGGEGDQYLDFIVETLKPHIDSVFRTRPERDYTGIMGSSFGGLISMYGIIEHQDVFSKAGVFSPSFWVSDLAYSHVINTGKEADVRIYLLAGEQESASMVSDLNAMYNTLLSAGFSENELFLITHPDGQHSEWYWAREFPDAYEWLFADAETTDAEVLHYENSIKLSPNPADSILTIETQTPRANYQYEIYHLDGRLLQKGQSQQDGNINVAHLQEGIYLVNLYTKNELVLSQKVVIK